VADRKIEYAEIAGVSVPAEKLVCPECHTLDLATEFDTTTEPWTAWCSEGHEFKVDVRPM
jgi:hypothetical protein